MQVKKTNISNKRFFALIYGQSGIGKTTQAATLEDTLIISAESGLLSLAGKEIDYVDIVGKTAKEKLESLRSIIGELPKTKYKTIFIDSLTDIGQIYLEYNFDLINNDRSKTLVAYGETAKQLKQFIKYMRDFRQFNVVMTALEKVDKDELSRRFVLPDIVGQLSHTAAQYFDFVFYYAKKEDETGEVRKFITNSQRGVIAKDRSGTLPEICEANIGNIFKEVTK